MNTNNLASSYKKSVITHEEYMNFLRNELVNKFSAKVNETVKSGRKALDKKRKQISSNKFFETLAKEIGTFLQDKLDEKKLQKVGGQISPATLERLVKYNYTSFNHNTLNKLALFLGYKGWTDFKIKKAKPIVPILKFPKEAVKQKIQEAVDYELTALKMLPKINIENAWKIYDNREVLNNFKKLLEEYNRRKLILEGGSVETKVVFLETGLRTAEVFVRELVYLNWLKRDTREQIMETRVNNCVYLLNYVVEPITDEIQDVRRKIYIKKIENGYELRGPNRGVGWIIVDKCISRKAFIDPVKYIDEGITTDIERALISYARR